MMIKMISGSLKTWNYTQITTLVFITAREKKYTRRIPTGKTGTAPV
jgi:hypothetical protein